MINDDESELLAEIFEQFFLSPTMNVDLHRNALIVTDQQQHTHHQQQRREREREREREERDHSGYEKSGRVFDSTQSLAYAVQQQYDDLDRFSCCCDCSSFSSFSSSCRRLRRRHRDDTRQCEKHVNVNEKRPDSDNSRDGERTTSKKDAKMKKRCHWSIMSSNLHSGKLVALAVLLDYAVLRPKVCFITAVSLFSSSCYRSLSHCRFYPQSVLSTLFSVYLFFLFFSFFSFVDFFMFTDVRYFFLLSVAYTDVFSSYSGANQTGENASKDNRIFVSIVAC
jgi:hypothetical protein